LTINRLPMACVPTPGPARSARNGRCCGPPSGLYPVWNICQSLPSLSPGRTVFPASLPIAMARRAWSDSSPASAASGLASPLVRLLNDAKADQVTRARAALALGEIGGKQVVGPLRKTLADQQIHWAAAHALGGVGPAARDAVPDLAKVVGDRAKADFGSSAEF